MNTQWVRIAYASSIESDIETAWRPGVQRPDNYLADGTIESWIEEGDGTREGGQDVRGPVR